MKNLQDKKIKEGNTLNPNDATDKKVLLFLKNLSQAKDTILPNKDLYHKILRNRSVTKQLGERYLSQEGEKGRNLLMNFNIFFMTFNWKVITAVCLVVVMGGVFAYWQLSPVYAPTSPSTEDVDLSGYTPATVVAIEDVDTVVDSVISESEAEIDALIEEELDIYLADAEATVLSELEQLYEAYEL